MKKQDSRVALRLPSKERRQVDELIKSGQYKNLSEAIRDALTRLLKEGENH